MKPIRIGLIGVNENSHCVQMHTRFHQYKDLFEVVGIAYPENEKTRLPGKVQKLQESWAKEGLAPVPEMTLEEMLNRPISSAKIPPKPQRDRV